MTAILNYVGVKPMHEDKTTLQILKTQLCITIVHLHLEFTKLTNSGMHCYFQYYALLLLCNIE